MNKRNRSLKADGPPAIGASRSAVEFHGMSQPRPSTLDELHQRLAEGGEQARQGNRPAIFRPRLAVHLDPELTVASGRDPRKLDFEIFISLQIFDRNSQVSFHKRIVASGLQKSPVHGLMHIQSFNNS